MVDDWQLAGSPHISGQDYTMPVEAHGRQTDATGKVQKGHGIPFQSHLQRIG